jgi:hypothetical protein
MNHRRNKIKTTIQNEKSAPWLSHFDASFIVCNFIEFT